jgi:predicted transcriptional regulator
MTRDIEERNSVYRLSDEERAAVRAGLDAARRGEFASEDDIEDFYQLHCHRSSLPGA